MFLGDSPADRLIPCEGWQPGRPRDLGPLAPCGLVADEANLWAKKYIAARVP